jgi:histidinol-phosphate aminotransferase
MTMEDRIRPNVRSLIPYTSARSTHQTGLLLDANENSFGSALPESDIDLHRYPDPYQRALRGRLAALERVSDTSIFAGVGSDEVIDLLLRVLCEPRTDRVLVVEPTYGMYRVAAAVNDLPVESVTLDNTFQIDRERTLGAVGPRTKIIFCCSPNNPTGNLLRRQDILDLCAATDALVVVDEAYVDFSDGPSLASDVAATENLVVLKTLSKSWGLAGIRLGYCIAAPALVSYLDKIKPPYNINVLSSSAALEALSHVERRDALLLKLRDERARLAGSLESFSFIEAIYPSDANFLLVRCTDAAGVVSNLGQHGIIIRDRSSQTTLERCVRITVGTREENDRLLAVLEEYEET